MGKQTAESRLKLYSILFMILAALSLVQIITIVLSGELNAANVEAAAGTTAAVAQASVITVLILAGISVVLKLVVGILGYREAVGQYKGSVHIKLAWVALVVFGLALISSIINMFKGTGSWADLCSNLVSVSILFYFIKEAKAVRSGE